MQTGSSQRKNKGGQQQGTGVEVAC
jgi:hypothetical protein